MRIIDFAAATLGVLLAVFVLVFGIALSIKHSFMQFDLKTAFKRASKGGKDSFSALATALGGTVGAGNIIGVAGAITLGGEGAVLWLVLGAFFGMIIKYSETRLAAERRIRLSSGEYRGGAMYVSQSPLATLPMLFCVFCVICSFVMGNFTQCAAIYSSSGLSRGWTVLLAVIMTAVLATVLSGGLKGIGSVSSVLVPFMGAVYLGGAICVIIANINALPNALVRIFTSALPLENGGVGILLPAACGMSRGLLSNEAGLGSSPIAHSSNETPSEVAGYMGIIEVFFSTVVVGLLTSLAIICSGVSATLSPELVTRKAFTSVFGFFGDGTVRLSTILFAFTSVTGWYFYGRCAVEYLFSYSRKALLCYKILYVASVPLALLVPIKISLRLSDIFCFFMCLCNLAILRRECGLFTGKKE